MNQPPYAMYEPPAPRSNSSVKWILIAAAAFLCLCTVGMGGLGYMIFQRVEEGPKPMAGYGQPQMIQDLGDGWQRFYFKDFKLTVDLPAYPEPVGIPWESEGLYISQWSGYEIDDEEVGFDMYTYRYLFNHDFSNRELAQQELEENQAYGNVLEHTIEETVISGRKVTLLRYQMEEDDEAWSGATLCFGSGREMTFLRVTWWDDATSESEAKRLMDSLKLDP